MEPKAHHLTMKQLPISDRPYEKLEHYGAQYLSNAELFAIIFRTGTKEDTSVDVARRLLLTVGNSEENLQSLWNMSLQQLQQVKGIGKVKALQVQAMLELGKRLSNCIQIRNKVITTPSDVVHYYMEEMRVLQKEYFKMILLDTKCKVIKDVTVSIGSLSSSIVHPREVFIEAIKNASASLILMHNHPSGDSTPSKEDISITKRLVEGGAILGIQIVDHIIFGNGNYISLKEKGYM